MIPYVRNVVLVRAKLAQLRPTQFSVGYAEVELKAAEWKRLKKKERQQVLESHVFPAVLGLEGAYYIVDHHHLGIALIEQGLKEVWVTKLDDLSWLEPAIFWRTMEFRSWTHPYDHRGRRRDFADMPRKLIRLQNDPYRSLAGLVRLAGGYAKDLAPFSEFLWADFFRPRVSARLIAEERVRATRMGVKLARSNDACYLPGWIGNAVLS
ncbi:MAG: ParB-like protein [Steroidobacteraceae bacterium]